MGGREGGREGSEGSEGVQNEHVSACAKVHTEVGVPRDPLNIKCGCGHLV